MSDTWKSFREHAAFAGDGMLLVVPLAVVLMVGSMNLLIGTGQGGVGFIAGAVFTLMATPIMVWLAHRRSATRAMWKAALVSTLVVTAGAGGLYALVVMHEVDQSRGFSTAVLVVLGLESLIALGLLADSIIDLARGREHTVLDVIRLAVLAFIAVLLALFSQNPDFGVVLMVLAPLCLAGAAAAALGDGLLTLQERSSRSGSPSMPAPSS